MNYGKVRLKSKGVWEIFDEEWQLTGSNFRYAMIEQRLTREIKRHIKTGICKPTPLMDTIDKIATLLEYYKECKHLLTYKVCAKLLLNLTNNP